MNCKNCNNPPSDKAKFCGKCGTKVPNESSRVVGAMKDKTVRGTRIMIGLFLGLGIFVISYNIIAFIVSIVGTFSLNAFDLHISENESLLRDIEAASGLLGFFGALIIASKIYKRVTKKNVDPNKKKPVKSFQMSQ